MKRGYNARSRNNLIEFKAGQSGNPMGRPRKIPELDELLAKVLSDETNGVTEAEIILRALLKKAKKGDVRAAELLLDRGYGKVMQGLSITTKEEPFIAQIEIIKVIRHEASTPQENERLTINN
jgi:hypothetical protein